MAGLSPSAVKLANEALWTEFPELRGRQLTSNAGDAAYRKRWMELYRQVQVPQGPPPSKPVGSACILCEQTSRQTIPVVVQPQALAAAVLSVPVQQDDPEVNGLLERVINSVAGSSQVTGPLAAVQRQPNHEQRHAYAMQEARTNPVFLEELRKAVENLAVQAVLKIAGIDWDTAKFLTGLYRYFESAGAVQIATDSPQAMARSVALVAAQGIVFAYKGVMAAAIAAGTIKATAIAAVILAVIAALPLMKIVLSFTTAYLYAYLNWRPEFSNIDSVETPNRSTNKTSDRPASEALPSGTALLDTMVEAIKSHEGWFPPGPKYPNGSRSWRNNNPGNLKFAGQAGATGQDESGFAVFSDEEAGKAALRRQILAGANGTSTVYNPAMTLEQFFEKYAPSGDDNDPKGYAAAVASKMGVDPSTFTIGSLASK